MEERILSEEGQWRRTRRSDRSVKKETAAVASDKEHPSTTATTSPAVAAAAATTVAAMSGPRNPFYERSNTRNNFPDFEIALKPGLLPSSSPSNNNNKIKNNRHAEDDISFDVVDDSDDNDDEAGCEDDHHRDHHHQPQQQLNWSSSSYVDQHSICSGGSCSILNLSIGARAALNEHLRYVAKYGIDGEHESFEHDDGEGEGNNDRRKEVHAIKEEEGILSNPNAPEETRSCHNTKNLLDEHWENLLEISSRVNSSGEAGSFVGDSGSALGPTTSVLPSPFEEASPLHNLIYAVSNEVDEDGIEIMADVNLTTDDYFNSSRVQLLATPERNRNRRVDMVVTRGNDEYSEDISLGEGSFIHDEPSSFEAASATAAAFPGILSSGIIHGSLHDSIDDDLHNTTLHSFNPGDISEVRRSLDLSFLSHDPPLELDVSTIVPATNAAFDPADISSMDPREVSYLSAPAERQVPNSNFAHWAADDILQKSFPLASPSALSRRRSPRRRSNIVRASVATAEHKENVSPEISSSTSHSKNTGSSLQSAMSSFLEEAKSMAVYVANELEQSFGGLESLPTDFLRAMDMSGGGGGNNSRNDPPSPISQVESNKSSSQESSKRKPQRQELHVRPTALARKELLSTGQGRHHPYFRAAVSRRVYDIPTGEEQDSFLAVRSNPETRRDDGNGSLLLDSFDVAATRVTL